MLEDQVAILLQRYLGDYVIGLNKEALKISVWKGDVELTNMQLRPEALNALKLPVKVKAGFLGSVKLKVPWNRLGQIPVLVDIDHIFVLAEPATQVEGCTDDSVQEAKKFRIQEMERKLLEKAQQLKSEVNKSWLGSLIDTIIGNLKLSISNIHIRYEDLESNPGHAFSAGVTLDKLSAVTVDNNGMEAFVTGGALDRIHKTVELESLALYLDSDITPWHASKSWEDLLPLEWDRSHTYILQPVTGNAKYSKLRRNGPAKSDEPLQKAVVNLDDVTMCLSKDAYRDILKLADNFAAFNQRLKYAHYRPLVSVKHDPRSWWKYACKSLSHQLKMTSGKLSWEHVLRYATMRKRYISLYVSLLKADPSHAIVVGDKDIEELDHELDIDLILQWRMLAHKFVEQAIETAMHSKQERKVKSWWSFGWSSQSVDSDPLCFTGEDWERLNKVIGYNAGNDDQSLSSQGEGDVLHTSIEIHMKHNASKLATDEHHCVAELSCESFSCSIRLFSETKVFDMNLGSYRLSSPNGLLAESATDYDSLVGVFSYKPFDSGLDWSVVAKASPCYMTYLKVSIDQIIHFFESNTVVSQTVALETAAAVQMTINEVKRTARQQVNRVLKDHTRFLLDLDIAAPKITIPSNYCPDNCHSTKLMLDLGNLLIYSRDDCEADSDLANEMEMYIQFNLILSDVSAFLVDGDYPWGKIPLTSGVSIHNPSDIRFWPVIDKCGVVVKLQQIRAENPSYPATRLAVRLPSLGFHFSPARYHRLMEVAKILKKSDDDSNFIRPWDQADFGGWLSVLAWKGVANREAVWQRRYLCLVGTFLYILNSPGSKSYNHFFSLQGKQVYRVSEELIGGMEHVLAICDATISKSKVIEDANAVILQCSFDDLRTWKSRLQGAVYRASGSATITSLYETSSNHDDSEGELAGSNDLTTPSELENLLLIGFLDELKILFSYSQHNFAKMLLTEEGHLFEFRAKGGQVELSVRSNDMFIGTVLKSLEIEDLVFCKGASQPCYLARSFIRSVDPDSSFVDAENRNLCIKDLAQSDGEENFFEAAEDLVEIPESGKELSKSIHEFLGSGLPSSSEKLSIKLPSFDRTARLLIDDAVQSRDEGTAPTDTLDSFVKAQIFIFDQRSRRYDNIDKQVIITLTTLLFFCRRPTILAIMDFTNAINAADDKSSLTNKQPNFSEEDYQKSTTVEEAVVKGLLGKGKSRIIFSLSLNMVHAQILLMKENETRLATLLQENLRANIKVYPSSFSINASLGNLKISDDSLNIDHLYYWICDMRDPGGSSFVQLVFNSFSVDDEDYEGYEYSLFGQFSEVRIVYLNRFVQEIICYFTGLVPNNSNGAVKLIDQVTNSEKWFTTSEFKGSPAVKLDLSLRKPIILMPRKTDSLDYLKLDVVHITIKNTFQWNCGINGEMNAVHVEILTILVEDINLSVGTGTELGDSIIQGVKGISVVVCRSLRDLLHQIPNTEAAIKMLELKASLSNMEYQIITECTLSNLSEVPNLVPSLNNDTVTCSIDVVDPVVPLAFGSVELEPQNNGTWTSLNVSVFIDLIELSLHSGVARDVSLATLQVSGAWLLYKSNTSGESYISATLKGFTVIDDREGVEQQFRLAVGKPAHIGCNHLRSAEKQPIVDAIFIEENNLKPVPTMLILDAKFGQSSSSVSLCVQRPQLLVALDFLLAFVEFFVPTVGSRLLNEDDENSLSTFDAVILDQSTYNQPTPEFSLSPRKLLVVDDENFDHFIYDGKGGILHLQDKDGRLLSASSVEPMIFIGNRKKLQFKNVIIKSGHLLGSCILLGINSSFSASEDDQVFFEKGGGLNVNNLRDSVVSSNTSAVSKTSELNIEIQAVGPELTFFNTSKVVEKSLILSNKLLHAQFDAFCRIVLKGDTTEMTANTLGLTLESNGIRILEPLDISIKLSDASGKTNIHFDASDVFFNLSFSILRLCLALEQDILAFLRMTSKKMTVVCSEFDKVGIIESLQRDQIYAFWRPRAPPGFAVLGDYLTAMDKPPTKGVLAVNTSFVSVKKAVSFKQIWPPLDSDCISNSDTMIYNGMGQNNLHIIEDGNCSIWFPVAPAGYVALGCVVSTGRRAPLISSAYCILASLVSAADLRDCIVISSSSIHPSKLAFWRVDNAVGTFLPADPSTLTLASKAYELRHIFFQPPKVSPQVTAAPNAEFSSHDETITSKGSSKISGWRFEAIASFKLVWWNQGSRSSKKLSIWRPVVPEGMVYFGDIAIQGFEPPGSCIVLHFMSDDLYRTPLNFQFVGKINKHRSTESISFWLPIAPLGFVSLGCIACKNTPKKNEFSSLGCMRSDMVGEDQFFENSVWDTYTMKIKTEPLSIWAVANELGTFVVRSGFKRPHKRFALKLADPNLPTGSDDIVIDAEIRTLSLALFDDYGGLMVPLCNISVSELRFNIHGRSKFLNSTARFSLAARSYNDKHDAWEPLVEPVDGFIRYQYDLCGPSATSQLHLTTKDLKLNISVSNANTIFQGYTSWNNVGGHVHGSNRKQDTVSQSDGGSSIANIHHKHDFTVIPQNKLGQDIFVCVMETSGQPSIIRMTSGDTKALIIPVSKNMLDSHIKGILSRKLRTLVAVIVADAQLPKIEGLSSHQFIVAVRLTSGQHLPNDSLPNEQSARTCGNYSEYSLSSRMEIVKWNEVFFFKVDSLECYVVELIVSDTRNGEPIGYFSTPLKEISRNIQQSIQTNNSDLTWIQLSMAKTMNKIKVDLTKKSFGKIKCAIVFSPPSEAENSGQSVFSDKKSGCIQISPTCEGPWTRMRLNYAAPAACWQFGDDVIGSEVMVKDGNKYLNIRSLVSVRNNTDILLDLCLKPRKCIDIMRSRSDVDSLEDLQINQSIFETKEFFETETYDPSVGWVGIPLEGGSFQQVISGIGLPSGWEWVDDWNLDKQYVTATDGWIYAPDLESLKWPQSYNSLKFVNYVRQRRWIRTSKQILDDVRQHISVGPLKPGNTIPLPLSSLIQSGFYTLQLKPLNINDLDEFSWSSVVDRSCLLEVFDSDKSNDYLEICVSNLMESQNLLHCTQIAGNQSNYSNGLWFCLDIQATEITKDIHSRSVEDWTLVVKPPLSITNFLPMAAEFSILWKQLESDLATCSRGILLPGKAVKVHDTDLRKPLYFSLLPRGGWLPINESVIIYHPSKAPSKSINFRSSISGRMIHVVLEQNHDSECPLRAKILRLYAPYWFTIAGCPPLTYRILNMEGRKQTQNISIPFLSKKNNEAVFTEVTEEEIYNGYTIDSALNFRYLGLSVSINHSGKGQFGPVSDLSPLSDMDGSLDLTAYDANGKCMRLFVSSKPCPYQSVPTKVISIRPLVTFTNRMGQGIFLKFGAEDEPKLLHPFDSRVSFLCHKTDEPDKLQVRLEDTEWSYPIKVVKEDTLFLVTRKPAGKQILLRTEIRGYEEGSRFVVVFRLGSAGGGPIRFENTTLSTTINIRQSGIDNDYWIPLFPQSTTMFSWDDPYGQKIIDAEANNGVNSSLHKFELEYTGLQSLDDELLRLQFCVLDVGNTKVARFTEDGMMEPGSSECRWLLTPAGSLEISRLTSKEQNDTSPMKIIVDFEVVGVSIIDHKPRELCYLHLERVFISYLSCYDGGTTSRFKLILGYLQLDNQLPLTIMPVMLVPEKATDIDNPVFKITISLRNNNADGVLVFPNFSIQVTETLWRLNIDEPIIWAFVDFYVNLQLDRLPKSSSVTQADPEIRIDIIDVSEVRLKVSLETAPGQRPIGALGVWGPILSAVGNALKIQVHLRKVLHRDKFMRRSSVIPAIGNRIWKDLIHNPLHLIFSLDVFGMTSSTLSSLGKGFAELSTDGQFLQLRTKQVRTRKISGIRDGFLQGTEAFAQGIVFGVSGVVKKPIESARQNGILGLAHGLGQACLGFIVQPVSGALDFFSLTVNGIGASCSRCLEIFKKNSFQRIRIPRAIRANGILTEYSEREALGQMILYLAEASRHFGCTEIFKEPSKYAWSDYYEEHFSVPYKRIVLVTNKRVVLLQCSSLDAMDKKPCKIMWDIEWDELLAMELAKAGSQRPSHLILHLRNFKRSEPFARVIKCSSDDDCDRNEQAVHICSVVHKIWKQYLSDLKCVTLMVPSNQRFVSFACREDNDKIWGNYKKSCISSRELSLSATPASEGNRFVNHCFNFQKIWSSDLELSSRCTLCQKQISEQCGICTIWRPICPDGYVSVGDVAHVGIHAPNICAVYRYIDHLFSLPLGYDLVWRNCLDDYTSAVSIWLPRSPPGFVSLGCVAVAGFMEPDWNPPIVYCVAESLAEETSFEDEKIWMASDPYPWACHIYQVQTEGLQFIALRQSFEDSGWKPMRLCDPPSSSSSSTQF